MIKVYDQNMKAIGELENAYKISVERTVNELWTASYKLPKNDPKQYLCSHLNFIEITSNSGKYYGLYRIMPTETKRSESEESITYKCEHVLATLLDDVIDGYMEQKINWTTSENLQRILDLQTEKRWELGNIEFERFFQYSFENENGLLAPILSIPKPFDTPYEFTFDTTAYPWKLNLVKSSNETVGEIRWGKDMIDFSEVSDPTDIVNYIIPKGAGEGVNQLTIEDANNGLRYLKDNESIAKWGLRKYIWIDRRFENAQSLKENAQSLLNQWKEPKISFECEAVDLSVKPEYRHERRLLNGVTNIIVEDKEYKARIIREKIDDLADEHNVKYEIANKLDDIATTQADIERKIQVNEAYSQGATNLDSYTFNNNCDEEFPAIIEFPFPDDMVNVNESKLRIKTTKYRGYTRGMKSAGQFVQGSTVKSATSSSGGGQTSSANGSHRHVMFSISDSTEYPEPPTSYREYDAYVEGYGYYPVFLPAGAGGLSTYEASDDHTHTTDDHSHTVQIEIPGINIPGHTHETEYGIYEYDTLPTSLTVKIDGEVVSFDGIEGEIDITDHLRKDSSGKVTRDYHTIEVSPNDLARISMIVTNRFFIRSHIGGTF